MREEFDCFAINKRHFRTKSHARMRLEAAVIAGMELYDNGRIAVLTLPLSLMAEIGATEADADDISSLANLLEGVDCGMVIKELPSGEWKISLRTGARLNASTICSKYGGGGHAAAAGCTLGGTAVEARDAMLAAVAEVANG